MIQRALELKERRERERQAVVEEKRMQQYRCVALSGASCVVLLGLTWTVVLVPASPATTVESRTRARSSTWC
jgi:hypothetical protein